MYIFKVLISRYLSVCVCVGENVCVYGEEDTGLDILLYHTLSYSFETGSLSKPGALSCTALGLQTLSGYTHGYSSVRDSNLEPHACTGKCS